MELQYTVTPAQLKEKLLKIARTEDPVAVFLWGQPGIGKTSIVYEVGKTTRKPVEVMILSLMDPTELKGFVFPNREKGKAEILPLKLPEEPFILFFDEFNTAPVAVQNSAMRIILERKIGSYALPEGTVVICAGNRLQDKAHVSKISSAMVNRVVHYHVVPSFEDFKVWWYQQSLPTDVIAYLEMDNENFCHQPQLDKPYPTPRSWEMVGKLIQAEMDREEDIAGAVGEEVALRFTTFRNNCHGIMQLATQVLAGEKVYPKKNEVEKSFMLATVLVNNITEDNLPLLLDYANNAPKYFEPYMVLWMKTALKTGKIDPSKLLDDPRTSKLSIRFTEKYDFIWK